MCNPQVVSSLHSVSSSLSTSVTTRFNSPYMLAMERREVGDSHKLVALVRALNLTDQSTQNRECLLLLLLLLFPLPQPLLKWTYTLLALLAWYFTSLHCILPNLWKLFKCKHITYYSWVYIIAFEYSYFKEALQHEFLIWNTLELPLGKYQCLLYSWLISRAVIGLL